MHILSVLAAAACLSVWTFAESQTLEQRQTPQCAIAGNRKQAAAFIYKQDSLFTPAQCGAACLANKACQTYAVGASTCNHYRAALGTLKVDKTTPTSLSFYERACATSTDLCVIRGTAKRGTIIKTSTAFLDNDFDGCGTLCQQTSGCQSFSTGSKGCRLFKATVGQNVVFDRKAKDIFWDATCASPDTSVPPPPEAPSHSTPAPIVLETQVPSVSSIAEFTPVVTDSPAYTPTGDQPAYGGYSSDEEFVANYSYDEYELDPPVDMGYDPIMTGISQPTDIPEAPCMVSTGPQAQVTILNENFVPLVSKASDQFGPVEVPTASPTPPDILAANPEDIVFPTFYFEVADGAPANTYDLVYAGGSTPQYVALKSDGNVVFAPSSSGPTFTNGLATSIFQVSCMGIISVVQGGTSWTWSTQGSYTKMVQGSGTSSTPFKALPKIVPAVEQAKKQRKRNMEIVRKLEKRMDKRSLYTEGGAPKCPANPGGLIANVKPDWQLGQGNLCENLSEFWGFSPFSFDKSCAVQSLCYDQCSSFTWEDCNGAFGTLAIISCAKHFGNWISAIFLGIPCIAQASYFTAVAATSQGREVFYKAQKAMCRCSCSSGYTCKYPNDQIYCPDLFGSDGDNCGTCGRTCSTKTTCKRGMCSCPRDQCGSTCLDFRNNPNNCGSCGNKCSSGYCVDGRCYTPNVNQCTPDPQPQQPTIAVGTDFGPWRPFWPQQEGCAFDVTGTTIPEDGSRAIKWKITPLGSGSCETYLTQQRVKICPGFTYAFTFNGKRMHTDRRAGCQVEWGLGQPIGGSFSPYQSHAWDIFETRWREYNGWEFSIQPNEAGVTKDGKNYYIDLWARTRCDSSGPRDAPNYGEISFGDVSIQAIGKLA